MKKLLLSLMALVLSIPVFAQDPVLTCQFGAEYNSGKISAYTKSWTVTVDGFTFDVVNFNNNNNGWNYVKCGRNGNASVASIATAAAVNAEINKIDLTIDAITADKVNSISLVIASDKEFATDVKTIEGKIEKGTQSFVIETPTAGLFYKLVFDCAAGTANGFVTVSKVEYYGQAVEVELPTVASIKETIALANNTKFVVGYALTVGFVNSKNIFACDAAGDFIQLFGTNTLKVGDVIPAGWTGTYTLFSGTTPEINFTALPEVTAGTFTPAVITVEQAGDVALVNHVATIKNVVFDAATPATKTNFTGKVDETTLNFRNNYSRASVEAGVYDVTVVVTIYQGATSLYVVSYEKAASDKAVCGLAYDADEVTVYANKLDEFEAPTLANPNNLEVTYATSDENIAEVSAAGVVTLSGDEGEVTITASFAGNDQFYAGQASYKIIVLPARSENAREVTFDFTKPEDFGYTSDKRNAGVDYDPAKGPLTVEPVEIAIDFNTAAANGGRLRFWWPEKVESATDFRCSATGGKANQTMTFSADGDVITKITFNANSFAMTANVGELGKYANKQAVWTGNAEEVVFTTTNACAFTSIIVEYEKSDRLSAGLAYSEALVEVYADKLDTFVAPTLANPNNLAVTFTSSDENVAAVTAEGVVTLTGDTGEATITAAFVGNDQFKKGKASYTIVVKPAQKKFDSVKAVIEGADANEFVVNFNLTVGFATNMSIYACDAAGDFIQLYGQNSLKQGDVIPAGWVANAYKLYSGVTPEIEFTKLPDTTEGVFVASELTAEQASNTEYVNYVGVVKNVQFDAATPATKDNFTGTVDGTELKFRNNYQLDSVQPGKYNVTVVVTIYQSAIQLNVIEFSVAQTTGIDELEAADAEEVYYNLQGVRIENPRNGIFVRVANGKAVKVVK